MKRKFAGALAVGLFWHGAVHAQKDSVSVTFAIDKNLAGPTPICVPASLPPEMGGVEAFTCGELEVQVTRPGLATEHLEPSRKGWIRRDLHFVVRGKLARGKPVTLELTPAKRAKARFSWQDKKDVSSELLLDDRPVLRYMCQPYDDSTPDKRNLTYKVFHHLYDPAGKRLVTNGGHHDDPKVDPQTFPHHRGLQMGWNKCIYAGGKKTADTWHCRKDDHQSHAGLLRAEAGNVVGRHRVAVHWHGPGKEVFLKEERELTVHNLAGGTLVEFCSRLCSAGGTVKLDGDPQHAGFQFRAHNHVALKTAKETYFLRPDGKDRPGQTRNWDPKTQKGPVDLPWNAMSFVLDDRRYTVCYLDHPDNPRPSRHSERSYGRFGCYFEREIIKDRPLVLRYRLWLQEGEMTVAQARGLNDAFATGISVQETSK